MYVCEGHIQYAALIHGLDGAYSLEANKFTANSQQSARKTGAIDQERRTVGTVGCECIQGPLCYPCKTLWNLASSPVHCESVRPLSQPKPQHKLKYGWLLLRSKFRLPYDKSNVNSVFFFKKAAAPMAIVDASQNT